MLVDIYILEGYTDPKNFNGYFHITEIFVEKYKILIGINHVSNTIYINYADSFNKNTIKTIISDTFIEKCYKCYCTQMLLEEEKIDALNEYSKQCKPVSYIPTIKPISDIQNIKPVPVIQNIKPVQKHNPLGSVNYII